MRSVPTLNQKNDARREANPAISKKFLTHAPLEFLQRSSNRA
jgi:hypothetical protein